MTGLGAYVKDIRKDLPTHFRPTFENAARCPFFAAWWPFGFCEIGYVA
jgi:hypothetical protein